MQGRGCAAVCMGVETAPRTCQNSRFRMRNGRDGEKKKHNECLLDGGTRNGVRPRRQKLNEIHSLNRIWSFRIRNDSGRRLTAGLHKLLDKRWPLETTTDC